MKTFLFVLLFSISQLSLAESTYYPETFLKITATSEVKDEALKNEIFKVLTSNHQRNASGPDTLGCPTAGVNNCYAQRTLGYDGARKVLFGKIHLKQDEGGKFYIKDVYCHKTFSGNQVRPGAIPNNNQINCEHTWPQSKFSNRYPKDIQKSDLHHLFPTDSHANSVRGNFNFSDISHDSGRLDDCNASKSGSSVTRGGDDYFEPPTEHKGNVARALFYFSIRYQITIPSGEEEVLRRWHQLDPVDSEELERNEQVYYHQGNRNPFIDFPHLANYINKF